MKEGSYFSYRRNGMHKDFTLIVLSEEGRKYLYNIDLKVEQGADALLYSKFKGVKSKRFIEHLKKQRHLALWQIGQTVFVENDQFSFSAKIVSIDKDTTIIKVQDENYRIGYCLVDEDDIFTIRLIKDKKINSEIYFEQ